MTRFGLIQFSEESKMSFQLAPHSNWTELAESVSGMDRLMSGGTYTASALEMSLDTLKNGAQTRVRYQLFGSRTTDTAAHQVGGTVKYSVLVV